MWPAVLGCSVWMVSPSLGRDGEVMTAHRSGCQSAVEAYCWDSVWGTSIGRLGVCMGLMQTEIGQGGGTDVIQENRSAWCDWSPWLTDQSRNGADFHERDGDWYDQRCGRTWGPCNWSKGKRMLHKSLKAFHRDRNDNINSAFSFFLHYYYYNNYYYYLLKAKCIRRSAGRF